MTVAGFRIQVGSTRWAKSLAVRFAQRNDRKTECQLVLSRPRHVDFAVDNAVSIFVRHPAKDLLTVGRDGFIPFGQASGAGEMGAARHREMCPDGLDEADDLPAHRHWPIDDRLPKTKVHGLLTCERTLLAGGSDQILDRDREVGRHLRSGRRVAPGERCGAHPGPSAPGW